MKTVQQPLTGRISVLSFVLSLVALCGDTERAAAQQPQLGVGQRVDVGFGATQHGTIKRIGTATPYVGCYFIHFDYQKSDPNGGDWHCPSRSRPITALDGSGAIAVAPARIGHADNGQTAKASAEAERLEKEAERLLTPTTTPVHTRQPPIAHRRVRESAPVPANPVSGVERGRYECYASSGGRLVPRMGLNFSITGTSTYAGVDGKAGSFTLDTRSGAMAFRGGALDGQRARYEPRNTKHLATVNFLNAHGDLGDACDRAD